MGREDTHHARLGRERKKLMESAIGAAGIGIVFLGAPLFLSNPMLKGVATGLRVPGFMAIGVGVLMYLLSRLAASSGESGSLASKLNARRTHAAREPASPRPRGRAEPVDVPMHAGGPSGGPLVADVVTTDYGKSQPELFTEAPSPQRTPSRWGSDVFDVIEWRRFEAVCERLFNQAGFETKSQSHGADGGIDIWLYSRNFTDGPVSVVQCKHWKSRPVKVAEVRELLGSMAHKKVARGIFATSSSFTSDARQFASENKIQLLDRQGLLGLISKRTPEQQQDLLAVATTGEYWVPTCASCGIKMVRRSKKSDEDSGRGFWGCAYFPRCRTRING